MVEEYRQLQSRRWRRRAAALVLVLLGCACLGIWDRRKADPPALGLAATASPKEVYEQLRKWRDSHSHGSMVPWVHPDSSDELVDLLIALDEMTTANTTVQVALDQYCPDIDPHQFDMSRIGYFLELFAQDAEFKREIIQGDQATVEIQVAGRLPLRDLKFARHEGRWVYMPGGVDRELVRGVRDLAKGLTRFAAAIAAGARTPEQLKSEFRYRVTSRLEVFLRQTASATAPAPQPAEATGLSS